MKLQIDASGISTLSRLLRTVAARIPGIREKNLTVLGNALVGVEKGILLQRRYTGELDESVGFIVSQNASELIVGPNIPDNNVDEDKIWAIWRGGKPRWVPKSSLQAWMAFRGISPDAFYPIWRSIARLGTSQWQVATRGSRDWPFPQETINSSDGQKALRLTARQLGRQISAEIEGA